MQKKINESQLKNIIAESIRNILREFTDNNVNAFEQLEETAREKIVEAENQIESLQNKIGLLESIPQVMASVDQQIKENYQGIQGPQPIDKNIFMYTLSEPGRYQEPTENSYGGFDKYEFIEDEIKEFFPEELKDYVFVRIADSDSNTISQIQVEIDIDNIEGWY